METKNRKLKIKVEGQPQCNIKAMRQSNEGTSQDSNPELILMGFQGVNLAKPTIASFLKPLQYCCWTVPARLRTGCAGILPTDEAADIIAQECCNCTKPFIWPALRTSFPSSPPAPPARGHIDISTISDNIDCGRESGPLHSSQQ